MATRTRTIRIPFAQYLTTPGLATATRHDFAAVTIPIPMTGSRVFRSVKVVLTYRTEASMTVTSTTVGIKLGAAAFDDSTVALSITTTGEDQDRIVERDVTAYFAANFGAGVSQTAQVGFQFVAAAGTITNISATLVITFDFDDAHASATTRVKTIPIVLDNPAVLSTVLTSVGGGNQIPALDSFLPETGKVYGAVWLELDGNVCSAATTDFVLQAALDADPATTVWNEDATNGSSTHAHVVWLLNSMTTNVAHDLKLASTVNTRYPHLRAVLWVTYSYDHAGSSRIANHARLPIMFNTPVSGDSTRPHRARRTLNIQEPGVITTMRSGVALDWKTAPSTVRELVLRVGSQAFRTFTEVGATLPVGYHSLGHRFDAGGLDGAGGIVLARGENVIDVDVYQEAEAVGDVATIVGHLSGWVDVVYSSDKHANGDGVHNHVVETLVFGFADLTTTTAYRVRTGADAAWIPSTTDWCCSGAGLWLTAHSRGLDDSVHVNAERKSTENGGPSWDCLGSSTSLLNSSAGELSSTTFMAAADDLLKRFAGDPVRPVDPSTGRRFNLWHNISPFGVGMTLVATYHQIKKTIAGSVTGFAGAGGGITVDVVRTDTGELVGRTTTAVGGAWSVDVYDDTRTYAAHAEENTTHVGRSYGATP